MSCVGRARPSGEAAAHPPAAVDARPPVELGEVKPRYFAGEQITWEVTFRGIEGGRARMAVGDPASVDGVQVLALHAQAESSGLLAVVKTFHDEIAAWLDADTGLPLRTVGDSNISGKAIHAEATFDHAARRVTVDYVVNGKPSKTGRRLPAGAVYDPLGVILVLRGWDAPNGQRAVFHTIGGRTLWRTDLVVDGRELHATKLGKLPCVRMTGTSYRLHASLAVDGKRPPRRFTAWFTDDARRVPVEILAHTELGDLQVAATSYETRPPLTSAR